MGGWGGGGGVAGVGWGGVGGYTLGSLVRVFQIFGAMSSNPIKQLAFCREREHQALPYPYDMCFR